MICQCVCVWSTCRICATNIISREKNTIKHLVEFFFPFVSFRTICCSELRYDTLCKQVIRDMNMYGMCVVDDFLGMTHGLGILNEGKKKKQIIMPINQWLTSNAFILICHLSKVHGLYAAGLFQVSFPIENRFRSGSNDEFTHLICLFRMDKLHRIQMLMWRQYVAIR